MTDVGLRILRPAPEKEWLTRKEVSRLLESLGCPYSPATLANMGEGQGPPFYKSGHSTVRYQRQDVIDWAKRRMRRVG